VALTALLKQRFCVLAATVNTLQTTNIKQQQSAAGTN
jgi:hypothetical protein